MGRQYPDQGSGQWQPQGRQQFPREAVTRQRHMSALEWCFHAFMLTCTLGLWYPVYRARKRATSGTVTRYR
jgi:hypothetical protein